MATLQQRMARGERDAFAELFDARADRLCHYLLVRLGNAEDAEDAMQETFLRLARNGRKLAKVGNLDAYLFTIARNEAARLASRRSRRRKNHEALSGRELFDGAADNASICEIADTAAALGQLNPDMREVVELKIHTGLTFQEIADVTGIPQGTAATRYRSAMEKMRDWLAR